MKDGKGQLVGYARVSTLDQSLAIQQTALTQAGVDRLFTDQRSGTSKEGRIGLQELLAYVREGDTVVITRIDRLARSIADLQDIVRLLKVKKVGLRATEQPLDISTAAGKAFLDLLGTFAEFELALKKERQMEGIAKAKAEGRYKGRKAVISVAEVRRLLAGGLGASDVARQLGIGRSSVYRVRQARSVHGPHDAR